MVPRLPAPMIKGKTKKHVEKNVNTQTKAPRHRISLPNVWAPASFSLSYLTLCLPLSCDASQLRPLSLPRRPFLLAVGLAHFHSLGLRWHITFLWKLHSLPCLVGGSLLMPPHHHTLMSHFILICLLVCPPQRLQLLEVKDCISVRVYIAECLLCSAQLSTGKKTDLQQMFPGTYHEPGTEMGLIQRVSGEDENHAVKFSSIKKMIMITFATRSLLFQLRSGRAISGARFLPCPASA